ncbi:TlpA family protein disulfide reductase [Micromonospora pisi]|uniref:TlpA family protein disulfide reductase n=1 Tax=Micromonospora pisi TaxID=589240 RepID=UPI001FEADED7|nr:thioredoxin family protein [Micromonospora pisi]
MQDSALTGPLVVVTVLVAATAFGLWRRRRDGRLRPVLARSGPAAHQGSGPGATHPVETTDPGRAAGARASDRQPDPIGTPDERVDPGLLTGLGVRLGTPVTLVQFSSAFCQPCRATRRVLGEVAGLLDGVEHVEVDAESQLAAVRALNIWRTPTTLVVDAEGRIVQRAAGVPAKAQVIAALAPLLTGTDR